MARKPFPWSPRPRGERAYRSENEELAGSAALRSWLPGMKHCLGESPQLFKVCARTYLSSQLMSPLDRGGALRS